MTSWRSYSQSLPDVVTMLRVFSGTPRFKPLAAWLMQSSLRRHLDEALKNFDRRHHVYDFTIDDLFPEEDVLDGTRLALARGSGCAGPCVRGRSSWPP